MGQPLERYDYERQNGAEAGMRREVAPGVVRYIDLLEQSSTIVYTHVAEAEIERVIDQEIAYFEQLRHELEWKVYAHDEPADLIERLRARGFTIDEPEAILVLAVNSAQARLFEPTPAVRRLLDPEEAPERIRWEMQNTPDQVSVYAAEVDGRQAACAWVRFPPKSAFASLWGGHTEPELRNRGLYSQLVRKRVQEARQRGYQYVTVDARSMSRPILERRGFQVMTIATACIWPPSA